MSYPILVSGHGARQSIYQASSTQFHKVGTRGQLHDGRVFYYARNSSIAINPGQMLQAEAVSAQNEDIATNTAAAGDTSVTITSGSATYSANDFGEGYMVVIDDTGEGITYKIRSHPAIGATTSVGIQIYDKIATAFGANTTVCLVKNLWADVILGADLLGTPVGVSNCAVGAGSTTKQYFWCQTWGVCGVWQDDATTLGRPLQIGATDGQVTAQAEGAGTLEQNLGQLLFTGTATEYQPTFLRIAP